MQLLVNEIFHSIQGESSYAGWPCVFVRLTGCNLRCSYCDTGYAYAEGSSMPLREIVDRVIAHQCRLVEITGGEPLLQAGTAPLVEQLIERGLLVLMETNGSLDIDLVDRQCVRIVDFKCPSSGEAERNDFGNIYRLTGRDEVKCVIADRRDYEFAREVFERVLSRQLPPPGITVHFSPAFGMLDPAQLVAWILEDRLSVRLNLQLHKYIWHPEQRGV